MGDLLILRLDLFLISLNDAAKERANEDERQANHSHNNIVVVGRRDILIKAIRAPSIVDVSLNSYLLLCEPTTPRFDSLEIDWDHRFLAHSFPSTFNSESFKAFKIPLALEFEALDALALLLSFFGEVQQSWVASDF